MSTETSYDLTDLLTRIAEGDERSFRQLYDLYWNRIYWTALAFTQAHDTAMEVVQETFLRVWKNRERLASIDNIEAFIYTIAKNRIKTLLAHHREFLSPDRFYMTDAPDANPSAETETAVRQFEALVHEATGLLPKQQAEVFRLSRFEHLSYQEIADTLNISTATVRNHLIKALSFMRNHFSERHKDLLILLVWMGYNIFPYFF